MILYYNKLNFRLNFNLKKLNQCDKGIAQDPFASVPSINVRPYNAKYNAIYVPQQSNHGRKDEEQPEL